MVVNAIDVEFHRMYNGLRARDLMPCLCRDFAVIFAIFTKVYRVFYHFFAVIFYCPYVLVSAPLNCFATSSATNYSGPVLPLG